MTTNGSNTGRLSGLVLPSDRHTPCIELLHCHDDAWKRVIKLRNLKPLNIFFFFFFFFCAVMWKDFIKTHSTESRCVIGREIYCSQTPPCVFQPGNVTGWGSKGVKFSSAPCSLLRPSTVHRQSPVDLVSKCCFTSTETIRTVRDGEPRAATSTFTQILTSEVDLVSTWAHASEGQISPCIASIF